MYKTAINYYCGQNNVHLLSYIHTSSNSLFLVQPKAVRITICSAATFASVNLDQRKSHSDLPPSAIAVQYTTGRMFTGTLLLLLFLLFFNSRQFLKLTDTMDWIRSLRILSLHL